MYTIFSFLSGLIGSLLLLRAWCWTLAITPRDPVVGFIWKATNWLVTPFGFVVRPRGDWDLPTLAATIFVALVQVWAGRELMGMPETATAFIVAIIAMALRCMNPQVIAVDEITEEEDIRAMCLAANCGVGLLASIHAASVDELHQKPLWRELLRARVFCRCIVIRSNGGARSYEVGDLPCSD